MATSNNQWTFSKSILFKCSSPKPSSCSENDLLTVHANTLTPGAAQFLLYFLPQESERGARWAKCTYVELKAVLDPTALVLISAPQQLSWRLKDWAPCNRELFTNILKQIGLYLGTMLIFEDDHGDDVHSGENIWADTWSGGNEGEGAPSRHLQGEARSCDCQPLILFTHAHILLVVMMVIRYRGWRWWFGWGIVTSGSQWNMTRRCTIHWLGAFSNPCHTLNADNDDDHYFPMLIMMAMMSNPNIWKGGLGLSVCQFKLF